MMSEQRSGFIRVDELMPRVTLEQVAAFYGATLPEIHRTGKETRMRCFLACGRSEATGDRVLAIQTEHPAKQWKCHQYGCTKGGNLISLCDLLRPGTNAGGRPRGARFKAIAADIRSMVEGVLSGPAAVETTGASPATPRPKEDARAERKINMPLSESSNERARALTDLDSKFVVDIAAMPQSASAYFRRRPFLTPEVCREWRVGYLPRDGGPDKSGGTMRGTIVYGYQSERGEVLTWFGRDPDFERRHAAWVLGGKTEREPEKFHFVKGFHRGLELFGQQSSRLKEPGFREAVARLGILLVEGPNDVIALDRLGIPAVALCSNTITDEQCAKLAQWAWQLAGGTVTLMLDCDEEGENGAQQALWKLAQRCRVRLGWSQEMFGGRFRGRQPESLTRAEWAAVQAFLMRSG